eukprot:TRINITY_DN14887_c0_g1_i2.p1 TRINITY_DN14887_c0_g1~~TRINITY_DN14887_c0_g1_i2.p1  ORF type:complete len:522 (+),score=165.03 TRINITY_DN14887_c0_g1_i2:87-1568(+)
MSQGAAQRRRCAAARLAAAALVIAAAALTLRSVPTEDADPAEQLSAAAAAGAPDAFSALLGEFCDRPKLHPSDLRHGLRVWAYPDPWTPGLLRHWNTRALRHQYSCDFGCRLCDERSWGNRGADMGMRQHGSGLSLLAKLLQLPHAESPEQADLFLVPVQFNLLWNREWHWISPMNDTAVAQAVASLRYLTPRTAGRHLFLPGGEEPSIHPAVRAMPLAAHLGPRVPVELCDAGRCYPARPQHIVIPSPLLQPDTQPGRYVHNATRPVFVFFFGGDPEHLPARRRAVQQLRDRAAEAKQRGLRLEVHTILSARGPRGKVWDRNYALQKNRRNMQPAQVRQMFRSSRYCLALPGDFPHTKRLFEAVAHGCVPVVVAHTLRTGEESWWRGEGAGAEAANYSRAVKGLPGGLADALPFADAVPWKDIAVRVPWEEFAAGRLLDWLLEYDARPGVYAGHAAAVLRWRAAVLFDWGGAERDAASLAIDQLARAVRRGL